MTTEIPKAISMQVEINLKMSINTNLSTACKSGYYLASRVINSFELALLDKSLNDWETLDKEEFNKSLKQIIRNNFDDFQRFVSEAIPKRHKITNCAFDLYKQGNYIALIPLVLSQVDGIIKEITGRNGFYASNVNLFKGDVYFDFLSNYTHLEIKNRNEYELFKKQANQNEFNRHAILHGESYDYSNDTNALKALLLLIFIAEVNNANLV